jgi:hypothetical protein
LAILDDGSRCCQYPLLNYKEAMEQPHATTNPMLKACAIAILVLALAAAGYVVFVKAPSDLGSNAVDLAQRIGTDMDDVIHFRPKITTAGTTIIEASKQITELSVVEKSFEHTYTWESTWLGSTKRLKLKGSFVAKAGYDLAKPFSIDISEDGQSILATMPPAKINSVEQAKVEILQDENGIWNKVSAQERQDVMNALAAEARKSLEQTSLLSDVDSALVTALEKVIRKNAPTAKIVREALP